MGDYQLIPRKLITCREQQRKHFGEAELAELAHTIRLHGILQPIIVVKEGDGYCVLAGQRRWLAAGLAGLEVVPATVREKPATESEAMEVRLIENLARQSLTPIEQANGLAQLMKATRLPAGDVAKRVGLNAAAVSKSLALLNLPPAIQEKIAAGTINATAGYELARVEDRKVQAELAEQVAGGTLSRDSLSARVKKLRKPTDESPPAKSRVTAMLDSRRSLTFSGGGLASVDVLIEWLEDLLSKARKVRPQNLALSTFIKVLRDQANS